MHHPSPLIAVAAALLVVLVGCASAAESEQSTSPAPPAPSSSPEPSAEPTPSASEEPQGIDTSDWLTYATHDGDMTYRYPSEWTVDSESTLFPSDADRADVRDPYDRWIDSSTLTAPNGQSLLQSADFADIGGACYPGPGSTYAILATERSSVTPIEADADMAIATLAMENADGRWTMGIGVTDVSYLEPTGAACWISFVFSSSDGGASMGTHFHLTGELDPLWTVDTLDDAEAYMETDEYATLVEVLRSVVTS